MINGDDTHGGSKAGPKNRGGIKAIRAARAAATSVLPPASIEMPYGFELHDAGKVFKHSSVTDTAKRQDGLWRIPASERDMPFRICGPFQVIAESRPETGDEWGLLLQWKDRDGSQHQWLMPRRLLAGEAVEVRARLAACGLDVSASQGARQALVQYLASVNVTARVRTVTRTGWHRPTGATPVFVLPGATYGAGVAIEIVRLDLDPVPIIYEQVGSLGGWRAELAAKCVGNSRLIFGVSCAFAPVLLDVVGDEGGGINLRGESSKGKTTIIDAAASVWGAPSKTGPRAFVRQWRTTGNAMEATAAAHNHVLLPLDEMGQADPREIGEILYMLAAGAGKDRARAGGGNRVSTTWTTLVLSSSEESAASLAAQGGRRIKAGQEVRLLDVPALVPSGYGCFEDLHGAAEGASFAQVVRRGTREHHGWAGPAFVAWLVDQLHQDKDYALQVIDAKCRNWMSAYVDAKADGQVARAARRIALIAIAGELATEAGVTGWPPGEAFRAAGRVFKDWLLERGGSGSREDHHLFAFVRHFLHVHGSSRFEHAKEADPSLQGDELADARQKTILRAGYRWQERSDDGYRWVYGMTPDVFAKEIAAGVGMEKRDAIARLGRAGMIRSEGTSVDRRWTIKSPRIIPGEGKQMRLIVFEPTKVNDEGEGD